MRTILVIIRKEFIQIFRNKTMLPIIFLMPIIQLFVLIHAATFEIKTVDLLVADQDHSTYAKELINKFNGSPFFNVQYVSNTRQASMQMLENQAHLCMIIPNNFEKDLINQGSASVQFLVNAINATKGGVSYAYAGYVVTDYNRAISSTFLPANATQTIQQIQINQLFWYNPEMDYKTFMLPGILVLLVTVIGLALSALNIVREKEIGTIEQINVSPIKRYQFIIGKLVPFWVITLFELSIGLIFGKLVFDVPIVGSLWLLFGFTSIYLLLVLSIGLFFSTFAQTQQQVMFIVFFFMLTFILMSGIFTPVESMPEWAQIVNRINPFAYFIRVIRMVMLKGSGFQDIKIEFFSVLGYGFIMLSLAVNRYRKTI